jgi:3-(3-hydroxy-phenyl)propionate hydroxylase
VIAEQRFERIGPFVYPQFGPTLPGLRDGMDTTRHKVAIVGGGPVGLAAALGLARFGVPSVIIEADDSVCMGSRAACVSRRSLEIMQRLGVLGAFLSKGLPWTGGRSFYIETEVFRFSMPHDAEQKLPPMINLQQYYIEQFLVDEVSRVNQRAPGSIEIRWASQLDGFRQSESGAELEITNTLGAYRLAADWVVACDGGQSFMRKQLGLAMHGTAYEGRYVIIDIDLPSEHPTERRAWFDPPWNRGSTVLMHEQPDNLWRIDYQLRHGEDAERALQPDQVEAFVQRHLDAIGERHLEWAPVWTSIYRAGAMTLEGYRHDRVLFAGNAAHAMPIFGVRGLNSGFDDADNLAWKLAYVIGGKAPATLLDTYSDERLQAFHINAESAKRSTEFMSPPSRGFDLFREAALSLAQEHRDIANLINPRQTQAVTYRDSALSSKSDVFAGGPEPGAVLVDLPLADGPARFLIDSLGTGFTCLVFSRSGAVLDTLEAFAGSADPPVKVVQVADPRVAAAYDATEGAVYLVRPDGHVAGRWRRPDRATLQSALARACGQAASTQRTAR